MKNKLAIALFSILFIVACRKEEPAPLPENGTLGEAHCSNGVMDQDEDGVDCGPTCEPCLLSLADCGGISPIENTFETTGGVNLAFTAGNVVASTSTGVLTITGTFGTKFVKVTFSNDDPIVFSAYSVVDFPPSAGQVRLQYYSGSGWYNGYSDLVHFNRINGKLSVEFCDVYMTIPTGGYTLGSGKLTEN